MGTTDITEKNANVINLPNRIEWIDIAKGIGIICVIIGHMGIYSVNRVVFSFHMPLFFIISGYVFHIDNRSFTNTLKRNYNSLIKPYIATCIAITLLSIMLNTITFHFYKILPDTYNWFIRSLYGSGTNANKTLFNIGQIGAIWFLLCLFWVRNFYTLISKIQSIFIWIIIVFLFFIGYHSVKYIYIMWSIQSAMTAILFYHIGYKIKQYNLLNIKPIITTLICLLIWGLCLYFNKDIMSIVRNKYPDISLNILGAITGTIVIINFSKLLTKFKISKILTYFGENSLIILCFHLIELNLLPWQSVLTKLGINNAYICYIIIFICKIVWCICGVHCCNNTKLGRWIFQKKVKSAIIRTVSK
ncbi:MAG: acyltransferase family protein [Spirochaetales bacterium]|nr:acyltransferase family protein [Spirochaetales bacterium]